MFPDDSNTIKHLDAVNLVGMIVRRTSPNRIPSLAILAVDEIDKPWLNPKGAVNTHKQL